MTKLKKKSAVEGKNSRDEDVLSIYLREINRIPLLTPEEAYETAQKAAKGDPAARDRLVKANLRFVVNVAKKYQGQGLPLSDLISEGNIGILNAIERFDAEKGYRFISYAVWWIRQAILKAICEKSRMIRLPLNRVNELIQIERARKAVSPQSTETELQEIAKMVDMDAAHVEDLLSISRELVSLDNPVNEDKSAYLLGDFVEDDSGQVPEDYVIRRALMADIESVLDTLNQKEADIIRLRFGLGEQSPMSLTEVGDHFNLTKERIRQIEKKALKRLRHPARQRILECYVA
ncbi:RNA polymerase sigma factor [Spirochaetia bacterium]|nr:RNA polymerase sigma factor [Spirochaetia bacterium]